MKAIISLFLFLQVVILQAQSVKVDLLAGYNWINPEVTSAISNRYYISGSSGLDGYELGLTGSIKKNNWSWKTELTYLQNRSNLQIFNRRWEEDYLQYGSASLAGGIGITSRMVRLSVNRAYFFTKNFSLNGGLIGIIQLDDPHYQEWPEELYQDWEKDMSRTTYEFARSINRFMLAGEASVAYHFGPLTCSLSIEKNFSSVISNVEYELQQYPVKYNYLTWTVGFAYTVFELEK